MLRKTLLAMTAALLVAGAAFAQSAAEFSRTSGGEFEATMKRPNMLSGSLGLSLSRSLSPFATFGNGRGYEGTIGGTIVKDRMWFFASGSMDRTAHFAPVTAGVPTIAMGTMTAAINNQQTIKTTFDRNAFATLPSSFLSLHYTAVLSPSMSFDAHVYQNRRAGTQVVFP